MLNCLTFDIEGFIEANLQSFVIEEAYIDRARELYEIEKNVDFILDLLSEFNVKATFFFLSNFAREFPSLVRKVGNLGHEIASHGHEHIRIYDINRNEFSERIRSAKYLLEDIASKEVYGFRAPDFSITESSIWALDILKDVGFIYDSSIYPFGYHDVYGIKNTNPFIYKLPNGLIEFPLSTIKFFNRRLPFGGGGYFRVYPMFFTEMCLRKINKIGEPCMFFIHPYEVGPIIPDIPNISAYRRFRHYYNCDNGNKRLERILSKFKFGSAIEVLSTNNHV
jgi:polysaccharide deacetylase family protein (PEP-CTERM system associated)